MLQCFPHSDPRPLFKEVLLLTSASDQQNMLLQGLNYIRPDSQIISSIYKTSNCNGTVKWSGDMLLRKQFRRQMIEIQILKKIMLTLGGPRGRLGYRCLATCDHPKERGKSTIGSLQILVNHTTPILRNKVHLYDIQ